MTSNVVQLPRRTCPSCRCNRHLRCADWVAMTVGENPSCGCGCWDATRRQTRGWAQARHAEADPFGYSRIMQVRLAIERNNSYDLHVPRTRSEHAAWVATRHHYEARRD